MKKQSRLQLFACLFLSAIIVLPQAVLAIAMAGDPINIKDAIRGEKFAEKLLVINPDPIIAYYEMQSSGDVADWITFYDPKNPSAPIKQIEIPAKTNLSIPLDIAIPETTPNGTYTGKISILAISSPNGQSNKEQETVHLKVDRTVSVTVSDKEVTGAKLTVIPSDYNIVTGQSLQMRLIIENSGNVSLKPDFQLKITGTDKQILNAIFPFPDDETALMPHESRELKTPIKWSTADQSLGAYRADYKLMSNGKTYAEGSFTFKIENAPLTASLTNAIGGDTANLWLIIAGVILVAALGSAKILKNRKQSQIKSA